ncbi:MAG: hypothetical protein RR334_01885, partial [Clostridia bacterium]
MTKPENNNKQENNNMSSIKLIQELITSNDLYGLAKSVQRMKGSLDNLSKTVSSRVQTVTPMPQVEQIDNQEAGVTAPTTTSINPQQSNTGARTRVFDSNSTDKSQYSARPAYNNGNNFVPRNTTNAGYSQQSTRPPFNNDISARPAYTPRPYNADGSPRPAYTPRP